MSNIKLVYAILVTKLSDFHMYFAEDIVELCPFTMISITGLSRGFFKKKNVLIVVKLTVYLSYGLCCLLNHVEIRCINNVIFCQEFLFPYLFDPSFYKPSKWSL